MVKHILMKLIVLICGIAIVDTVMKGPAVSRNVASMSGHPKENITFIWTYNYTKSIDVIIFNRKNEKTKKIVHLGFVERGILNRSISRPFMFNKTGDLEGMIYLTLLNTTAEDYNLNYTCRIVFNDKTSSSNISIFLSGGPSVFSNVTNMHGHPKNNATFMWYYIYTLPIHTIIFNRKNAQNKKFDHIGFWEYGNFSQGDSRLKDRVMFNKTDDLEGIIYLTLLNTTAEDYNLNYTCKIVFNDKTSSSDISIFLSGGPVVFSNVTHLCCFLHDNVTFIWNYYYTEPIQRIIFNREDEQNKRIDPVGFWEHGIFNPDDSRVKEIVMFNKTGDLSGAIYLTWLNTTAGDYNLNYTSRIAFNDSRSSSNMSIFLVRCPEMNSKGTYMYGRPKENIKFVWRYVYTEPIDKIFFNRAHGRNGKIDTIGCWYGGEFLPKIPRLKFNKTEEQITLTLLDASREDFNYSYICHIIFNDKQDISWSILLEEKAPLFVKDGSVLSTGEVAAIAVSVIVVIVIIVVVIIVWARRSEFVRQKIQSYKGGNNIDNANQAELNPLQGSNIRSEDEALVDGVQAKSTAVVI